MATTSKGFYYPISSDSPDIPTHIQTLATGVDTYFDNKANLASPALTGTPTAPTAAADTNTTQIATTAYVIGQGYAKLASPTLTTPRLANSTTTATSGLLDYNGDIFTATTSGTSTGKGMIPATYWAYSNANSSAITTNTPVAIFPAGARSITLEAAKTYYFKLLLNFTATFTSGTANIQLVPTFSNAPVAINYLSFYIPPTAGNSLATRGTATTATTISPNVTATITNGLITVEGHFQSNATTGGTLQFNAQMSTTGTSTVFNSGSYQQIIKLGTGAPAAVSGTWT